MLMMNSLRRAESSKESKRESQMISGIRVCNVLFLMVLSMFGLADCRSRHEEVKLVMLWGGIFDFGIKTGHPPTKEDNVHWSQFKGTIHKSKMRFQMVLFLFE
jgi:hypothetical protein